VSTILNKNTDGTRTVPLGERELMQELTPTSINYGGISIGTDGTLAGEKRVAMMENLPSIYASQLVQGDLILTNTKEVPTQVAVTYTGNGGSQSIVTNMSTIELVEM
jgi:hypothetical protein